MRTTNSPKAEKGIALVIVVLSLLFIIWIATILFPTAKAETLANVMPSLDNAVPYTRYPRFVMSACSDALLYKDTTTSRGGNTYSEMWFIFGNDNCNVAPLMLKASTTRTSVDDTVVVTPPVIIVPPVVIIVPPVVEPKHKHCNKGEGNGSEGCDPGKHPEKGNNDEDNKAPSDNNKGGNGKSKGNDK